MPLHIAFFAHLEGSIAQGVAVTGIGVVSAVGNSATDEVLGLGAAAKRYCCFVMRLHHRGAG